MKSFDTMKLQEEIYALCPHRKIEVNFTNGHKFSIYIDENPLSSVLFKDMQIKINGYIFVISFYFSVNKQYMDIDIISHIIDKIVCVISKSLKKELEKRKKNKKRTNNVSPNK